MEIKNGDEYGSGFLIADQLVLTAYHVVRPLGGQPDLRVSRLRDTARFGAALLWPTEPVDVERNRQDDLALLRITDPEWAAPRVPPVRLGQLPETEAECAFLCFPRFKAGRSFRDSRVERRGSVEPLDDARGLFSIKVRREDASFGAPGQSRWPGASGAAVWSGGLLVGVLTRDVSHLEPRGSGHDRLAAIRIEQFLGHGAKQLPFVDALLIHGIQPAAPEAAAEAAAVVFTKDPSAPPSAAGTTSTARSRRVGLQALTGLLLLGLAVAAWPLLGQHLAVGSTMLPARASGTAGVFAAMLLLLGRRGRRPTGAPRELSAAEEKLRRAFAEDLRDRRRRALGGAGSGSAIDVPFHLLPGRLRPARSAPTGSFTGVLEYFLPLSPQRLVITGPPGSGKSLLALELANRLLGDRSNPLAFFTGIASWDPTAPFLDWLTGVVAQQYEGIDPELVRALVTTERLVPVLDGLDEMDTAAALHLRARAALDKLTDYPHPVVLTCRQEAFRELAAQDAWLRGAATVALEKVSPAAAEEYLTAHQADLDLLRETRVLAGLHHAESAFAMALDSPWMLSLLAAVSRSRAGAAALRAFTADLPRSEEAVRGLRTLLVSQLVPARVEGSSDRPRAFTQQAVQNWLSTIARFLYVEGLPTQPEQPRSRRDIVPHRLWPICGDQAPRLAAAALTAACWLPLYTCLLLALLTKHYLPFPGLGLLALLTALPAISIRSVHGRWVQPRDINLRSLRTPLGRRRAGRGLLLGGLLALADAYCFPWPFAVSFGAGFAFVFGTGFAVAVRRDVDEYTAQRTGGLIGAVTALLGGVAAHRFGAVGGLACGWGAGALGLILAVRRGIAVRQRDGSDPGGLPDPDFSGLATPATAVRRDLRAGLIAGSLVAGLALWATLTPALSVPVPLAVATAVSAGLAAGLGFVAEASRVYAGMLLIARGRLLPWRLTAFLEWAHREELLRTAARAYQFRHDELLEHLGGGSPWSGLTGHGGADSLPGPSHRG
ncbi:serine protease [Streptomyces tateyamensis]|uniref:serine protease n=1 Tax=Streptomyces tateyamensis TaxID=565073 RepID=UPI0015E8C6F2|nr:serine protease [Streptomyces tateyamensis]